MSELKSRQDENDAWVNGKEGGDGETEVPEPKWDRRAEPLQMGSGTIGGGDGIRTHCLYIANVALYQLSYTPEEVSTLPQGAMTLGFALPGFDRLRLIEL
jgi:hypothetical protein